MAVKLNKWAFLHNLVLRFNTPGLLNTENVWSTDNMTDEI